MRSWSNRSIRRVLPFCLPLLLGACASLQGSTLESQGDQAFDLAHYTQALDFYQEVAKLRPDDPDLARKIEIARTAVFYSRGKEAYFEGRLSEAERWFRRILRRHPDQEPARRWLQRLREKQARILADRAADLASQGSSEKAMELLRRSLDLLPENPRARDLLAKLRQRRERILKKGRLLVREGLRTLREALGSGDETLALYHLEGAQKVMGADFRFPWLLKELERRFLTRILAEIRQALEEDLFPRALFLARYARTFFPRNLDVLALEKQARRELKAQRFAQEAHTELVRGNPDKAERLLREAARLSRNRAGLYLAGLEDVREVRLALAYEDARNKEYEGLYKEALARLRKVASQAPDFRDVEARMKDLEASLKEGDRLLAEAKALAARGRKAEALQLLKELFSLLPFYKEALELKERLQEE